MSNELTSTLWLQRLRDGDNPAVQKLWEAYYGKLVALARRKLEGRTRLVADEEDIALSAFKSFCRGMQANRYPNLADRDDLWRLLVTITVHKAIRVVRDETRQKRGGEWRQITEPDSAETALVEQLVGAEPTPELAAQVAEEYERLLQRLQSPDLVELAVMKMEGYSNQEIAEKWGKAERTVERKLQLIRRHWVFEGP